MVSNIEIVAYLGVIVLCIIAFVRLTKAYSLSQRKLPSNDIINLAKTIMLTFGFIIVKITLDYILVADYIGDELYFSFSILSTVIILGGIIYSVKLMIDFSNKFPSL
jgi:small-conductance mechanosensitive channel